MRFDINLASQPYQDMQRFLVRWGLAILALLVVTAGLVYAAGTAVMSWRQTARQQGTLSAQIRERDREKATVEEILDRPQNRQTRDRSQLLNSLIARKAFSWTEVFSDLEKLVPPRLHVTAIRPQINDNNQLEIILSVAGPSRDGAVELVRRLEQSPHFTRAEVRSETTQRMNPNSPDTVLFEVSALYLPAFNRARTQQAEVKPATEALNAGR